MPTDIAHLQYVSEVFASLADVVLVVKDGDNNIHFPVHTAIVSGYSPLLCDVLQQMNLPATAGASLAKLVMHGDRPAEVQAALDCIYKPFATENASGRHVYLLTDIQQPHLIRFAFKYGMSTVLADLETALLAHFSSAWADGLNTPQPPICNIGVVRIAAAAESCKQQRLLAHCELHLVLNFARLEGQLLAAEQLSGHSLMRIARGLAHCHKHDIQIMDTVLSKFSQEAENAVISAKHSIATCPRNPCEGVLYSHTGDVYVTKYARCNKDQCRWPHTSGLRQKAEEAAFVKWRAELLLLLRSWQTSS